MTLGVDRVSHLLQRNTASGDQHNPDLDLARAVAATSISVVASVASSVFTFAFFLFLHLSFLIYQS
jgi:hypothetical protein